METFPPAPDFPPQREMGYDAPNAAVPSLSIGSVLSRSFATLCKAPVLFFILGFLSALPNLILERLVLHSPGMRLFFQFVSIAAGLVIQGAIAYGVFQVLRKESAALGSALGRGFARVIPLFFAAILVGLGTTAGFVALLIPGLIFICMWMVTIPACVVERLGAVASMRRSAELTKGYRWTLLVLWLLLSFSYIVSFLKRICGTNLALVTFRVGEIVRS